jgi:hypothetical protein
MAAGDERLARAERPVEEALHLHLFYRGNVQMLRKCPITSDRDVASSAKTLTKSGAQDMSGRSDLAALINLHGAVPSEAERHMSKFAA